MKILLTGGLGYIGSHIAKILGRSAIIIDNKSNSSLNYKKFLPLATVYVKSINKASLKKIFLNHKIDGVIHLAGLKSVNQSIKDPLNYYNQNVSSTLMLLDAMNDFHINKFIFSSSATVYGKDYTSPLKETLDTKSINPYGNTKLINEKLIMDYSKSNSNFRAISLRYFNPIGADVDSGLLEQPLVEAQNLMPVLIQCVKEKKIFKIFGNNYPTRDGTCIRDYIHIKDLADAHLLAFNSLTKIKSYEAINIGLGKGISVLEIIKTFEKINKINVKYKIIGRRNGDSAISYANNRKAKRILKWQPKYDIEDMVRDSWGAFLKALQE